MDMTRFTDETIAFEQKQKSRYLASNESSDCHIGFPISVQLYLKFFTLNLIEIQVDDCLKSKSRPRAIHVREV